MKKLKHRLFGHKWIPAYINKKGKYRFIATYCETCHYGWDELIDFLLKHEPIINSRNKKYFDL